MALADEYDGFLIDLDGVVLLGGEIIPGADEAISALAAAGKPFVFVTNSPRLSPAERAEQLRELGIPAEERQLITSGTAIIELLHREVGEDQAVLAVGTPSFRSQVATAGFDVLAPEDWPRAAAVLLSVHNDFSFAELKGASMAARAGAKLFATGRDPTMPMPDGLWPGTGAVLAAVETASGRKAKIAGKPGQAIFRTGIAQLDLPPDSRVAMIGDRLDSDISGAQAAGIDGVLVSGNESSNPRADQPIEPQHRIEKLINLFD